MMFAPGEQARSNGSLALLERLAARPRPHNYRTSSAASFFPVRPNPAVAAQYYRVHHSHQCSGVSHRNTYLLLATKSDVEPHHIPEVVLSCLDIVGAELSSEIVDLGRANRYMRS